GLEIENNDAVRALGDQIDVAGDEIATGGKARDGVFEAIPALTRRDTEGVKGGERTYYVLDGVRQMRLEGGADRGACHGVVGALLRPKRESDGDVDRLAEDAAEPALLAPQEARRCSLGERTRRQMPARGFNRPRAPYLGQLGVAMADFE